MLQQLVSRMIEVDWQRCHDHLDRSTSPHWISFCGVMRRVVYEIAIYTAEELVARVLVALFNKHLAFLSAQTAINLQESIVHSMKCKIV